MFAHGSPTEPTTRGTIEPRFISSSNQQIATATWRWPPIRSHPAAWWCSQPSLRMGQPSALACRQVATTPTNLCVSSVPSGGLVVLAAFAEDGPTECSGLPTSRYDTDELVCVFGPAFSLEHRSEER